MEVSLGKYTRGLDYGRIKLSDQQDTLLWSHSKYVGSLSVAKGYDCISVNCFDPLAPMLEFLWHQRIPLKIACFTWLMARGRILTWDQLQKKGFQGPGICILCKRNLEDISHLFLYCPISVRILAYFAAKFGFVTPFHDSVSSLLI